MRRIVFGIAVAVTTLLSPVSASAATADALTTHEARSAAEGEAFEFQDHHKLGSDDVGRCARRSRLRVDCEATAVGETTRRVKRCDLRIRVRAVRETYFWGLLEGWDAQASITSHRCRTESTPYLALARARPGLQRAADEFAGVSTKITDLERNGDVGYRAKAKWERPAVHPTEDFPTERCSVELEATLGSDRTIAVATEGFSCS
jgi:hypothetical protein